MRVLCIPFVSLAKLSADSGYTAMCSIVLRWKSIYPDLKVYMVVPHHAELDESVPDWIQHVADRNQSGAGQMLYPPSTFVERFGMATGAMPIDLIVTSRIASIPALRVMSMDPRFEGVRVPIVGFELMDGKGKGGIDVPTRDMERMKAFGYANADMCLFLTPTVKRNALKACSRWVAPSHMNTVQDLWIDSWGGLNERWIEPLLPKGPKLRSENEPLSVLYGGRMNTTKQWPRVAAAMDTIYRSGRNVKCFFSTQTQTPIAHEIRKKYSGVEFLQGVGRQQWHSFLKGAHVFLYACPQESYPGGVCEAICSGLIPVLPKADWVEGVLGKRKFKDEHGNELERYPFLWSNRVEAFALVDYLYDNYNSPLVQTLRDQLIDRMKYGDWGKNWRDRAVDVIHQMEELVYTSNDAAVKSISKGHGATVMEAYEELGETFGLNEVWEGYNSKKLVKAAQFPFSRSHLTRWQVYKYMVSTGVARDIGGEMPSFVKLTEGL